MLDERGLDTVQDRRGFGAAGAPETAGAPGTRGTSGTVGTVAPAGRVAGVPSADVLNVIRGRNVIRDYTAEPIDDATVELLLDAMLAAPSASNKQAWAFVVVRDPVRVRRIRAFSPGVIGLPPLLIVACFDLSRAPGDPHVKDVGALCVAMAVQNVLLSAHALGLGACPVSSFLAEPVRGLLELPPPVHPVLLVPVGHPARGPQPSPRRMKEEVVHRETW